MFEAKALAINVFPVPGGPYIKHPKIKHKLPFGGLIPTLLKSYGFVRGN
jgi:hypothetical protein